MHIPPLRHTFFVGSLFLFGACADTPVATPPRETEPLPSLAAFDCTADVAVGSLRCRPGGAGQGGAVGDLLLGGQGTYVRLTSSGVSYDGASVFSAQVTVQNLLGQPIGTTDGVAADQDGIRVFFAAGPSVTGGTGTVSVDNEDGTDVFTGNDQPFFRYAEVLGAHETSAAHEWRFAVPSTVLTFAFTVYVAAPVPDEGALGAIDLDPRTLAVGGYHSCALSTAGDAYCWGSNYDGQVTGTGDAAAPRLVPGGHKWKSITAGLYSSCGVTTAGAAYCWGDNALGQLGTGGSGTDSSVPVAVAGGRTWAQLEVGALHACGVTTDREAFCWGYGDFGQLGDSTSASSAAPVAVHGGFRWASVDAGTSHSCGVTRGGAAMCWGDDLYGDLGNGAEGWSPSPVLVAGGRSWISVSAGSQFSCGITSDGAAMCWGTDASGQLGNGAGGNEDSPRAVEGGGTWARLRVGTEAACGITTAGAAYCWGHNSSGQLGDGGSPENTHAPAAVPGGLTWTWIDIGDGHGCGIRPTGEARCWGYNFYGQLGANSTETGYNQVTVSGGITWAQ
jgi:alpha-tubulin suppressor-like RCC1 family protein